jgi:hypothetical protein
VKDAELGPVVAGVLALGALAGVSVLIKFLAVVAVLVVIGLAWLCAMLWVDRTRSHRRGPVPTAVSTRIAILEHELLDGPFGHDGCNWCVMDRVSFAAQPKDDVFTSPAGV